MIGLTRLDITFTCISPLRIDGIGIDFNRDWVGRACIPAAMMKGHTRDHVRRLALALGETVCDPHIPCVNAPCAVCRLFGSSAREGTVSFTDVVTDATPILIDRMRTSRSRTRGVTMPVGAHQVLVLPTNTVLMGNVLHRLSRNETRPLALLIAALRGVKQLGAGGAVGWGQGTFNIRGEQVDPTVLATAFGLDSEHDSA